MMIWCIVLIYASFAFAETSLVSDIKDWEAFKKEHSKQYDSIAEEEHRFRIFVDNKHQIANHNLHFENGIASFKMGLNKYSDMRPEDFAARMNGYDSSDDDEEVDEAFGFDAPDNVTLPDFVDWREKGAVTDVKDQGHCGSCYAFASTGALESHHFIKNGDLVPLSEQELVDCSDNSGCQRGRTKRAFKYVRDNGIATEESYPYQADDGDCDEPTEKSDVIVRGFVKIPYGDEHQLKKAIATIGPVAVSMDTSHHTFHHYKSGIYYEPACSSHRLHHAVLVVGYGTDDHERDYYIVKNSWGTDWGMDGYFHIIRNHMNHCGIATRPIYPVVSKNQHIIINL